jgi:hypothetical protein
VTLDVLLSIALCSVRICPLRILDLSIGPYRIKFPIRVWPSLVEMAAISFSDVATLTGGAKCSLVSSCLGLSKAKLFGKFGCPPDVSADEVFGCCDGQDIGHKEASMMGAKCSWLAVSLQTKSGNFGRPPDSIDFSPCNHQRLEWSGNLCHGFQALIIDVSVGGAGEDLIIKVNLSPACSALKDILALSGRPPDWIVKCQSGFNGSLKHDSLRSPIPVAFGLGEALTGGAKCSVMASCGDFGRQDELLAQ